MDHSNDGYINCLQLQLQLEDTKIHELQEFPPALKEEILVCLLLHCPPAKAGGN